MLHSLSHISHTLLLPLERLLSLSHKQWRTHSLKLTLNRSHAQRGHTPVSQSLTHRLKGALLSLSPLTRTDWRGKTHPQLYLRSLSNTQWRTPSLSDSLTRNLSHREEDTLPLPLTQTQNEGHTNSHSYRRDRVDGALTHTHLLSLSHTQSGGHTHSHTHFYPHSITHIDGE